MLHVARSLTAAFMLLPITAFYGCEMTLMAPFSTLSLYPSPFVATLHLHRPVVGQSERRLHALAQGEGTAQGVH